MSMSMCLSLICILSSIIVASVTSLASGAVHLECSTTDPHGTGLLNGFICNARLWCKGTPKPLSGIVPRWLPNIWVTTRYPPLSVSYCL